MCSSPRPAPRLRRPIMTGGLTRADHESFLQQFRESSDNVDRLRAQREAEFLAREPAWSHEAEIDRLRCPLHLKQMHDALSQTGPGQILKLHVASEALLKDLTAAARQLALETSSLRFRGKRFLYIRAA